MEELTDTLSTLTGLFKDQTLYKTDDNLTAIKYEGGNNRHITLVFNNPDLTTEARIEKEILNRMFARLNTSFNDIALINNANLNGLSFAQINKELAPLAFVSFGLPPSAFSLNIEAPLHRTLQMGIIKILFCDDLLTIDKNNNLKKKFWAEFAPLFA